MRNKDAAEDKGETRRRRWAGIKTRLKIKAGRGGAGGPGKKERWRKV